MRNGGFTYLGVVIMLAIISITAAAGVQVGAIVQRRMIEEELLVIGAEFRSALASYANATPNGQARTPRSLLDLLKDPRYPSTHRYLRKLYVDPVTGKSEWGTVPSPDGGIIGVYSLSNLKPIKIGNFDVMFQNFEGKTSYRDWQFTILLPAPTSGLNTSHF